MTELKHKIKYKRMQQKRSLQEEVYLSLLRASDVGKVKQQLQGNTATTFRDLTVVDFGKWWGMQEQSPTMGPPNLKKAKKPKKPKRTLASYC